jgi:hypothetical protein
MHATQTAAIDANMRPLPYALCNNSGMKDTALTHIIPGPKGAID